MKKSMKIIKYKYQYDDIVYYILNDTVCKGKVTNMNIHRSTLKITYGVDYQLEYTENELYDTEKKAKIALIKKTIEFKKWEIKRYQRELKELKNETI